MNKSRENFGICQKQLETVSQMITGLVEYTKQLRLCYSPLVVHVVRGDVVHGYWSFFRCLFFHVLNFLSLRSPSTVSDSYFFCCCSPVSCHPVGSLLTRSSHRILDHFRLLCPSTFWAVNHIVSF